MDQGSRLFAPADRGTARHRAGRRSPGARTPQPAIWLFLTSLLLALGYQVYRIVPFTPLMPVQALGSSGAPIDFHGVNPKPPRPSVDADGRDAELLIVGDEVAAEDEPAIVAGDLNDVARSQANQLFQEISGLLDPRIGRGIYATYNPNWPLPAAALRPHLLRGNRPRS